MPASRQSTTSRAIFLLDGILYEQGRLHTTRHKLFTVQSRLPQWSLPAQYCLQASFIVVAVSLRLPFTRFRLTKTKRVMGRATDGRTHVFRCVHANLYEGLSFRRSVDHAFFQNLGILVKMAENNLQTACKMQPHLELTYYRNHGPRHKEMEKERFR